MSNTVKKILITGQNSYIGESLENWLNKSDTQYKIDSMDMKNPLWRKLDFSRYDVIFHVAGIAHIKETEENRELYFKVNRDLAYETARKAKEEGIKQFIFLSSMSVYGITSGVITKETIPNPNTAYGKSKYEAEKLINELVDENFKVAILRPPMVYGKGAKGNYQLLSKFAQKSPIFPDYENKRSMIYIDNLSEYIKNIIDKELNGLFFPQNKEYMNTSEMVKIIAGTNGKNIKLLSLFNPILRILNRVNIIEKVFGDLIYKDLNQEFEIDMKFMGVMESIKKSENKNSKDIWFLHHYATPPSLNGFTRPYHFSKNLRKEGFESKIFTSSYLHFSGKEMIKDNKLSEKIYEDEVEFNFIKTYPSSQGFKRVINMYTYYRNVKKALIQEIKKFGIPNAIIASSPHPLTLIAGIQISKKYKIPYITEIRDFWPEVFFINDVVNENGLIGKILLKGEYWIYKNSDKIIFLKEGDFTYLLDKGWDLSSNGAINLEDVHYINNGVDLSEFDYNAEHNVILDDDLQNNKFKVIYAGSIRPVNQVDLIVRAASQLKEYKDIVFLVYGEGTQLEDLKALAKKNKLKNIKFKGYVEKNNIPYILSQSSLNILNYSQEKYNWSRGNSSNKLFEYMAAGKPILSTVQMGYCPIKRYKIGKTIETFDEESLAQSILEIYALSSKKYLEISKNSRKSVENYTYKNLTKKLINVLEELDD